MMDFIMEYLCPAAMGLCFIGIIVTVIAWITGAFDDRQQQYDEGHRAGLNGLPPQCCPYGHSKYCSTSDGDDAEAWMRGWQQGAMELRNGGSKR